MVDRTELTQQTDPMKDDLVKREDAETLLKPHFSALLRCVQGSWGEWQDGVSRVNTWAVLGSRTRASALNDLISVKAEEYFADVAEAVTSRKRGFLTVTFPEARVVLRFKKYRNRRLHTSGIPTEQRRMIEAQEYTFEGMAHTYLVVGYLPDRIGDELEKVAISCSVGRHLVWQMSIDDLGEARVVPVQTLEPLAPAAQSTRVIAKKQDAPEGL